MKKELLFVILAIFLLHITFALDIGIYSPEKGTTVDSRATYVFQVMGETGKTANCQLLFNGVKYAAFDAKTNEQVAYTQLTPMGNINWSVSCTIDGQTIESTPRTIIVMDVSAPSVTIHTPMNQTYFADETIFINVTIDDSSKIQGKAYLQHLNLSLNRTKELDFDNGYYVESIPISKELVSGDYLITIIATDEANRTTNKTTMMTIHPLYIINVTAPQLVEEKKPAVISGTVSDDTGLPVKNKDLELTLPNNQKIMTPITDGVFFYTLDTTGMQTGAIIATLQDNARDFVGSATITITPIQNTASLATPEPTVAQQAEIITQQVDEIKEAVQLPKLEEAVTQKNETAVFAAAKTTKIYGLLFVLVVIILIGFFMHNKRGNTFEADLYDYLNRRRKMGK